MAESNIRDEKAKQIMNLILTSIKPEDIYLRGFHKPMEITLKK